MQSRERTRPRTAFILMVGIVTVPSLGKKYELSVPTGCVFSQVEPPNSV